MTDFTTTGEALPTVDRRRRPERMFLIEATCPLTGHPIRFAFTDFAVADHHYSYALRRCPGLNWRRHVLVTDRPDYCVAEIESLREELDRHDEENK